MHGMHILESRLSSSFMLDQGEVKFRCEGQGRCGTCEHCRLLLKVAETKEWFPHLEFKMKREFIVSLLKNLSSSDLTETLSFFFQTFEFKDFTYSITRHQYSSASNVSWTNVTRMDKGTRHLEKMIETAREYLSWFREASSWSKRNYLLRLLSLCDTQILHLVRKLERFSAVTGLERFNSPMSSLHSSLKSSKITFPIGMPHKNSTHHEDATLSESSREELADLASPSYQVVEQTDLRHSTPYQILSITNRNMASSIGVHESRKVSISEALGKELGMPSDKQLDQAVLLDQSHSKEKRASGIIFKKGSASRCFPYSSKQDSEDLCQRRSSTNFGDGEDYLSCYDSDFETGTEGDQSGDYGPCVNSRKDLIRFLPVYVSKYILRLLDKASLNNCLCVSLHWRFLTEQVYSELSKTQINEEDIMLIKGTMGKNFSPIYAKHIPVHVLKVDSQNNPIANEEPKFVDIINDDPIVESRDMQWCYDGYETNIEEMEERNLFCGAYNVLILSDRTDHTRRTYFDGGNYLTIGSLDRKIKVLNVSTSKYERVIQGHAGSIKSIITDNKKGLIISGSYDTSIRCWDMKTGKCRLILKGHQGSVVCLALHGDNLASSSTDRAVKVWDIKNGKCRRTFKHRHTIRAIQIHDPYLLTGSNNGKVRLWNFEAGIVIKVLVGHMKSIACVTFNANHIVTGGEDCYVLVWSTRSTFTKCLQTLKHPSGILCMQLMFCRIITGAADGKIRVWSILNGDCLRILRGNSRNDPITALYTTEDRILVNTYSGVILYKFEEIEWDYNCGPDWLEKGYNVKCARRLASKPSHSFTRAMKMLRIGSALHAGTDTPEVKRNFRRDVAGSDLQSPSHSIKSECLVGKRRIKSAPTQATRASVSTHIQRIKSAYTCRNFMNEDPGKSYNKGENKDFVRSRSSSRTMPCNGEFSLKIVPMDNPLSTMECSSIGRPPDSPLYLAQSRSSPALRVKTLPPGERGYTSHSDVTAEMRPAAIFKQRVRMIEPNSRPLSHEERKLIKSPAEMFENLTIRSYYQQLVHEEVLKQKNIKK